MDRALHEIAPVLGAGLFIFLVGLTTVVRRTWIMPWHLPAALSILFGCWSLYAVSSEGPLGFWNEHRRDAWSNQIWFDLLLAVGFAWTMLLPRARSVGMRPLPWLGLVVGTGCIGLGAMFARCLFLERAATAPSHRPRERLA